MRFVTLLRPEVIVLDPPWRGFRETVEGLTATLAQNGLVPDANVDAAARAIVAREAEASTAVLEIGIGVPHARLTGLANPAVALALSADGLYEAVPTVPIRIVALVLSPPQAVDDHLRILASISTLLRSPELRSTLVRAPDPATALAALRQHARPAP